MKTAAYTGPGYLPRNDRQVVCLKALWVCLLRWNSSCQGCRVRGSLFWLVYMCCVLVGTIAVKVPYRRGLSLDWPPALIPFLPEPQTRSLQCGKNASSVVGRNRLSCVCPPPPLPP